MAMLMDNFARENLPPREQWPDLLDAGLAYPERLNAAAALLAGGRPGSRCLLSPDASWSYGETAERVERIASVLTGELGMIPGNRVLLRAPNAPLLAVAILAVIRAGGVAVPTMSMLRAGELRKVIDKARIGLALCDHRLTGALAGFSDLRTVPMGGDGADDLTAMMAKAALPCPAADTAADDVCLIAFTSGTTGEPKGTMHFHRDLLAVCDTYGAHVLRPRPDDLFVGSPPLAFTFGLGGLLLFPLRVGAATLLLEQASPEHLLAAFRAHRPSVCFTAPTAFRAMLGQMQPGDTAGLRACVSAGEALPRSVWEAWFAATGIRILDGIGSTEMLHIFIGSPEEAIRPGATGLPVPGYEAKLIDEAGRTLPRGSEGRLAVRGPTGCRYLADARQTAYVVDGWNVTGDTYFQDEDGCFWFRARSDDMIVSAGYNIAGPEVEAALLGHGSVAECAVVAAPDVARGHVARAFVVLRPGAEASEALARTLQEHVKATIAPYKYPRLVSFVERLPRTETGKLQRFALRERAEREAGVPAASP